MTATPTNAAKFAAWCAQSDPKPNTLEEALRERSVFPTPAPMQPEPAPDVLPPAETQTNASKFVGWFPPQPRTLEEALLHSERSPFSDPEPLTGDPSVADLMAQIRADSSSTNTR